MADGLATRQAFHLPTMMLRDLVDDFVLVSEEQLCTAIQLLVEKAHTIAEGAGAAPLAAAIKLKEELKGKKVALVITGGNITFQNLCQIIL